MEKGLKRLKRFKISLSGSCPETHNRLTQKALDFKKTLKKIKNLIKLGYKENIIINIDVFTSNHPETSNYYRLHDIVRLVLGLGIKKIQFTLINPQQNNLIVSLDKVAKYISKARYVFLFDVLIKVKGLPYCLIPEPESVILKSQKSKDFIKLKRCKTCRYNKECNGILKGYFKNLYKNKIKPQILPKEVMVEVTPRCNFKCKFCFNRVSFAKQGHLGKELTTSYLKKIIDSIEKAGVRVVRFTGGEPMLREDIFELIKYAKAKGLETRLNTNGSLIKSYKMAKEMAKYLDYVLFSMHTYDPKKDEKITGFKGSFEKKVRAVRWFKKAGVKTVRMSTIATLDNIKNLEKFYQLFKEMKIDKWATNRLIPLPGEKKFWGRKELPLLVNKLIKIKKDIVKNNLSLKLHIVNAAPLCADDPIKMNAICSGARSVDGHERFVIDPRGFAKPIYYIEKNIGNPLDILACWNHPFMKSLRSYNHLPKECRKCPLLEKCKGGNRYSAYAIFGSYQAKDPLMNYSNIKDYLW